MATSINNIRNRITADDKTGAAFQSAGKNATKYGKVSSMAAEVARRGFRAAAIAITAVATATVAAVAGSFRLTASMAESEDKVGKFSQRIGVSVEALSSYQHAAELSGVSNEQLNLSWQRMTRRISEATTGSGVAVKSLEALNLTAVELNKLSPDEQFLKIGQALSEVNNQSEKVRLAFSLFDTEGVSVIQMLGRGAEGLREMTAEADLLGLTITGKAAASAAAFNDELLRMQNTATGIIRIFTNELKPIFTVVFREIKLALLDSREASEDFAASIQDRVVKAMGMALNVMRFFHNAWLGIKLVGTVALNAIAHSIDILFMGLRVLLAPLDLIFAGLKAMGQIDVNPFDTAQNALEDFSSATTDQTAQVLTDIESTNAAYDEVGRTIDGLTAKINAQRAANEEGGALLSAPDARVTREQLTQEQLQAIRDEAMAIELETELAFDANFEAIHQDQLARKQKEIDLEKAAAASRRTAINSGLTDLATVARASNASFETQKKISIAQGLVGTYQATIDAFKSAGNPYLGAVLAALAFAANIAQVNAIRRTKPGSTSATAPTTGALPTTATTPAAPAAPINQPQQINQTTVIELRGDLDVDMFAAKLKPSFDKFAERGTFPQVQTQGG